MHTIEGSFEEKLVEVVKNKTKYSEVLVLFLVWQNVDAIIELVQPIVNVLISKNAFSC